MRQKRISFGGPLYPQNTPHHSPTPPPASSTPTLASHRLNTGSPQLQHLAPSTPTSNAMTASVSPPTLSLSHSPSVSSFDTARPLSSLPQWNLPTNDFSGLDSTFEELDHRVQASSVFQQMFKLIRICSNQSSAAATVVAIERHCRYFFSADSCRVFLVHRDVLSHLATRTQPFDINAGLIGWCRANQRSIELSSLLTDQRYLADIDLPLECRLPLPGSSGATSVVLNFRPAAEDFAALIFPLDADTRSDCAAPTETVGVLQLVRQRPFSQSETRFAQRLCAVLGNLLKASRQADRANHLYQQTLVTHKRNIALLDVARALASETKFVDFLGGCPLLSLIFSFSCQTRINRFNYRQSSSRVARLRSLYAFLR